MDRTINDDLRPPTEAKEIVLNVLTDLLEKHPEASDKIQADIDGLRSGRLKAVVSKPLTDEGPCLECGISYNLHNLKMLTDCANKAWSGQ